MALKVVGVGLGRTGTNSLKLALEQLLGGPCYHMFELIAHPQKVPLWERAVRGEEVDWDSLFDGYAATVDWPGCAFWRDLAAANPEAIRQLKQAMWSDVGDWDQLLERRAAISGALALSAHTRAAIEKFEKT